MAQHHLLAKVQKTALPAILRLLKARKKAFDAGRSLERGLDFANSEVERYAFHVSNRLLLFNGVQATLALVADMIRSAGPSRIPDTYGLFELQRHHMVVHRAQIPTAKDSALRLVAAVWDLGLPEKYLANEKLIYENKRHMTPALKAALGKLSRIVNPYLEERNEILHEGRSVTADEGDWAAIHQAGSDLVGEEQQTFMRDAFSREFQRLAANIDADVKAIEVAEHELCDALDPIYSRHLDMLTAVAGEEA